jgi:hypothetical protein
VYSPIGSTKHLRIFNCILFSTSPAKPEPRLTSQWFPTTIRFFLTNARNWRQNTLNIGGDLLVPCTKVVVIYPGSQTGIWKVRGYVVVVAIEDVDR